MAENLGNGVSYVSDSAGYNYDMVVFQEQKPPLDSELNLSQELKRLSGQRNLDTLSSGWLTLRPYYTNSSLQNKFYTQNPDSPVPEYALVNGMVVNVTNTNTDPEMSSIDNDNLIDLREPPTTGNRVNGVFLEVWRALLDPDNDINKPDPEVVIDNINAVYTQSVNLAWGVGANGLILNTENAGSSWLIQTIDTKRALNGVSFGSDAIGWVVGDNGVIARTSSGGVRWALLSSGFVENLNDVCATSQLIAWAVGDAGTILKTNNGVNWLAQESGVTIKLNGLYFYDTQIGWACGANGTILRTTDGGTNWLSLNSGVSSNLKSIAFYGLNIGFAVGDGGVILRTSDGGLTWVSQSGNIYDPDTQVFSNLSVDYTDVTMAPNLDEWVDGEEVSGQFYGPNKNCTVMNVPVTNGDGLGTVTNTPGDIRVTVNGVDALVDVLDGLTGQLILHEAPRVCDTVLVYYYYKIPTEIFRGRAWVTGASGTVLVTDDIGAKWVKQEIDISYDLNSVDFVNINNGWVVGDFSSIRYTDDGGADWQTQISDVVSRQQQRVYKEGNVHTDIFLLEDSIHPDTNIETTKRVQIQYRIRVENNVDPVSFPEAGLGNSGIVGFGPNKTGSFAFENMGGTTGDYGLWQAKCAGTVDGYCWAIPMAFVGRRNSLKYDNSLNANGSHETDSVRPDLLTGTDIVDADILDVRRKVSPPDVNELLARNFDMLLNNQFRTQIVRDTQGGDRYGTEILNVDRIGGIEDDGGRIIDASLADAVSGDVKASVKIEPEPKDILATTVLPQSATLIVIAPNIFHPNIAHYTAKYDAPGSENNNKPIPGYWEGMGTTEVIFNFSTKAKTKDDDSAIEKYMFIADYIDASSKALTFIPTNPKLVKNTQENSPSFYYQGVIETETGGHEIESWDSGIPGYTNYALSFPHTGNQYDASPVKVHYFMKLTEADILDVNTVRVPLNLTVTGGVSPTIAYQAYTVSNLMNVTDPSGKINYLLTDQKPVSVDGVIELTTTSSFNFVEDMVLEIVYAIKSDIGDSGIRNGSSVSFVQSDKGIKNFMYSDVFTKTSETGSTSFTEFLISNGSQNIPGVFVGVSTTTTGDSATQLFALVDDHVTVSLYPVTVDNFDLNTITIHYLTATPTGDFDVSIQAMILQTDLLYNDSSSTAGLLIGYHYTPFQAIQGLPTTLTAQMATTPKNLYMSNLGTGGSSYKRDPYGNPLVQIPTNDVIIADDNSFYNIDPFRFSNITVDGGFVQMPIYVPGSFGEDVTFSLPSKDNIGRSYYGNASKEFLFKSEGLKIGLARKIFIPVLARVSNSSDLKLLRGEYVLLIVSRNALTELDNYTGYEVGGNSVIAVYRLPNKPLVRF